MRAFPASGKENPAIVVCPGGAYAFKAFDQEGYDAGKWMQKFGVSAYVLDYRVLPYHHPCALMDVQRAIRYLRHHAKELNLNPKMIGVMGFSAGGHLAGCLLYTSSCR